MKPRALPGITLFFSALLLVFLLTNAHAAIYVKWDSPGPTFDGTSWNSAFHTVQEGLNAAASGDEVWVARGTYVERITLKDGVVLLGGYAGVGTTRDIAACTTVLDGNKRGTVVTCPSGATGTTVIDGFTVRNGRAVSGGGISCSSCSPTITHNTIRDNTSLTYGGGIYCYSSNALIAHNLIMGNNGVISGGAVYCTTNASPVIANNVITGNDRGAVYCTASSSPIITSNTIAGNGGSSEGGIYCYSSSAPLISNNIIAFNASGVRASYSTPTLRNNCVYGNAKYDYSGVAPGTGDISADPLLAGLEYRGFRIQAGSPCINAGWNEAPGLRSTDIDGEPRTHGTTTDIGADESDGLATWSEEPNIIIYVSPSGNDGNDGSSWGFAKRTVQAGIDAASARGGEVWVQAGTYMERTVLQPFAHLYGGFAGIEDLRSERDWTANVATLDGARAGSVVTVSVGHRVSTIDGFLIQNGGGIQYGGGVNCKDAGPTIANNTIQHGDATSGAGIYCSNSCPIIEGNTVRFNWSNIGGGGVYCSGFYGRISGNTIVGNRVLGSGGGLYLAGSSAVVANNVICGNSGASGGGVWISSCAPMLTNNTIAGNQGDGIYCSEASPTIANTIIAFNLHGIRNAGTGLPSPLNSNVYGNAFNYSGISDPTGTNGNISADPMFASAQYGNYHIQPGSPCIDSGDGALARSESDMDGQARVQDGKVDMGADESDATTWSSDPGVIVRVSPTGDDANDGASWASAKQTVQAAVEAAKETGGEVWVKAGTYTGLVTMRPFTSIYGGFDGLETSRSERDRSANVTVLDGGGAGSVVSVALGYRVSAIDGFTIRNGNGGGSGNGGGIYCLTGSADITNNTITANIGSGVRCGSGVMPVITHNTLSSNTRSGVFCENASPMIADNTITGNADSGVYCFSYGAPTITRNIIADNTVGSGGGGGITCSNADPTISHNTITGNRAVDGGGISCRNYAAPTIWNNIIIGNTATGYGGGIYCSGDYTSAKICNNTITGNTATGGGGMILRQRTPAAVSNNIIAFNSSGIIQVECTPALRNNCVFGNASYDYSGLSAAQGDISLDPLFADRANGDYHLTAPSPCINAGWNDAPGLPLFDMDGQGRVFGRRVDIGADEYWSDVMSVTDARYAPDASKISGRDAIVTAAFDGCFYIEAEDRSCGIRVEKPGHGVQAGDRVDVSGTLMTNADGERCIEAASVQKTGTGSIAPLHINARALGGSDWFYNPASGAGQCGVVGGLGLNNIGLLVTTWGKLSGLDGKYSLSLGSNKIADVLVDGMSISSLDTYVRLTGISSCYRGTDGLHPKIRVTDIKPL